MQYSKVFTGIAIIVAIIVLSLPIWADYFRFCLFRSIDMNAESVDGQRRSCDNVLEYFPSFLGFFFPVVGVGIWIVVFGIQNRGMFTLQKKENNDQST
jgi:hypothetical protein